MKGNNIDVLRVMDDAIQGMALFKLGTKDMHKARSAVVDLIAAADEASVALGESMEHSHQLAAHMRLCNALDNVLSPK